MYEDDWIIMAFFKVKTKQNEKKIHKVCVTKGVIYHHEEEENHSHS